ncbi:hypothetical protein CEP54_007797 [Fusarium duplospermum]|uniref:Heterokaryon incompatibility domain-containing protein n=1 Tax=Fusarium duplospermum TaxID=1325734 RepID=A0A428PZG2_9HYPO|nr:hypothetical protein CEP54_007797 [Fusarium duplospermum]
MASGNSVPPHTCEHCQRIILDKPVKKEAYGQYEVTLPHTRSEVYQAVQAGCPLFSRYPKFPFFDLSLGQSLDPSSWQPWFDQPRFLRFEGWQRRSALMLAKSMLNPYDKPFEISYNTEGDFGLRCLSWVTEIDTMRIVAPPEDPAAQDIVFRPIKEQVDTEETFEFLRSQTQKCYETHCHQGTCPPPKGDFAPRRVIRIDGPTDPPSLRLYAPEAGEDVRWCALSYCWGGQDQSVMTTVATLQARLDGIDFGKLPKTLQDAIITTHRLGIYSSASLLDIRKQWNHLITAYSQRNLTYPADKLIAFSAIPKTLDRPGRYLAGLWETDLPCNLLWKVTHLWFPSSGTVDKRKAKLETYRAPSWSWASVDGEVDCKLGVESSIPEPACEVLDVKVDLANDDAPFGAVVSGYIVIRGDVRKAVFYPLADEDTIAADNPSVDVCCLHIRNFGGRGEGLLLVKDAEDEVYRRIGHFYWNLEELGVSFEYAEKAEVKIV